VRWSKRSTPELLMALDTLTDSTLQILIRNEDIPAGKRSRIYFNTKHALAITRTLIRRLNADKVVNLRRAAGGNPPLSRRNWRRYKREKRVEKLTNYLPE